MDDFDRLDLVAIQQSLGTGSLHFLPETTSTNDRALEWIQSGALQTPALVLTENQTQGRGQRERTWISSRGNLAASWIFSIPENAWPSAGMLAIAAAVAVHQVLAERIPYSSESARIKWPNDILLRGKKVAGILVETLPLPGGNQTAVVVGIGINVNAELPDRNSLAGGLEPTSLKIELSRKTDLTRLVCDLTDRLPDCVRQVNQDPGGLVTGYGRHMSGIGQPMTVETGQHAVRGICRGISLSGALLLECESGLVEFSSGRIQAG